MDGTADKVNQVARTIAVRNLTFAYARSPVLQEISFTLEPQAVGLLGPNGSGKTTLLRALLGHLPLPSQVVTVLGHDMVQAPRAARRQLGWMPELGGIIPGMSGVSMVAYLGELSGMPSRDGMQRAHEVLDYVGLGEARYRNCEDYSQGMRQRLKLAQALVHDPAWVLLDEPTSGLDPKGRVAMLNLVRDLAARKGLGVILSTHLLPDVETVCDEILVLREGRLLAHRDLDRKADTGQQVYEIEGFGPDDAFFDHLGGLGLKVTRGRRLSQVTVTDGDGPAMILQAALRTGYALRRLRRQTVSLDDLFHQLVQE